VQSDNLQFADRVRAAVVRAALEAYEDASIQGLCSEGAWEAAVSAMRRLDMDQVLAALPDGRDG
jgi:hypothetical protein